MLVARLGQVVTTLPKSDRTCRGNRQSGHSATAVRVTVTELVSGKEAVDARLKQLSAA